jgi:ATP-binding cassette subfamily F protein 3
MIAITANGIEMGFGTDVVLGGVSFTVQAGEKIGLIGPNGAGKSTLLRILTGEQEQTAGTFSVHRDLRVGYLRQEKAAPEIGLGGGAPGGLDETALAGVGRAGAGSGNAVYAAHAEAADGFALAGAGRAGADAGNAARTPTALSSTAAVYAEAVRAGAEVYESEIRGSLTALGFTADDFGKPVSVLSGGERARLEMAQLFLRKPDLLLLDEPTNHLDLNMLAWLEQRVRGFAGTVLLISHDRYFLDRTVSRIFELEGARLYDYAGNFSDYREKKRALVIAEEKAYEAGIAEIRRQEDLIRRFKERGTEKLAKRAASREKRLAHAPRPEAPTRRLDPAAMKLSFGQAKRSGDDVLLAENLSRSFGGGGGNAGAGAGAGIGSSSGGNAGAGAGAGIGSASSGNAKAKAGAGAWSSIGSSSGGNAEAGNVLFSGIDLELKRGEKVCMIGANGVGKTTLLKILAGKTVGDTGHVERGANVKIGYYDQHQEGLRPERTLLAEMRGVLPYEADTDLRKLLGRFLFFGDKVFQEIRTLSGGEKARLALLKLIVSGANTLFLDEPTNHLDIASMEVVEAALADFDGTFLVISHDRYLLERLPSRILELTPQGMRDYPGNFDYYLEKRDAGASGSGMSGAGGLGGSGRPGAGGSGRANSGGTGAGGSGGSGRPGAGDSGMSGAGGSGGSGRPGAGGSGRANSGGTGVGGTGAGSSGTGFGSGPQAAKPLTASAEERRNAKQAESARRRQERLLAETEERIETLEGEIADIEARQTAEESATDFELLARLHAEAVGKRTELDALYERWAELADRSDGNA